MQTHSNKNYNENQKREELDAKREHSYDNLINAPLAADKSTLLEKIINNLPFRISGLYIILFRLMGFSVGKNVRIYGPVSLKIRGNPKNIMIGDEVIIRKNIDLRNRENGKIILHKRVHLDESIRLVAARDGAIEMGTGVEVGRGTVINSGGLTSIGRYTMIAVNTTITSSAHGYASDSFIKEQAYTHGKIEIGEDVFIGAGTSILMNTKINKGAVISANSLVSGEIPPFTICMGVPVRPVKTRIPKDTA